MPNEYFPTGPAYDAQNPPPTIEYLLRQVHWDDESQLAPVSLLRAYRREALSAVAKYVDTRDREREVMAARQRLRRRLLALVSDGA
jgi:hypothetical protein